MLADARGITIAPKLAQLVTEAVGAALIDQQAHHVPDGHARAPRRLYLGMGSAAGSSTSSTCATPSNTSGTSRAPASSWIADPLTNLLHGQVDALLTAISTLPAPTTEADALIPTTVAYFAKRRTMLDYPSFRAHGYQIGSGLAESACKRLVSQREKGAGMHWTVPGAQAIATLRAAHLTHRWSDVIDAAKAA